MVIESKFGKTICSICYEDLKPIVEDLQVISICGHVFHELCLQQWFEYCSSTKKCTCPVCKQSCSANNVSRLYFQSVGDQIESLISQKRIDSDAEDPEFLRSEVKRLEVKVSRLNSALESQGKELKEINVELSNCKERLKEELALKNEVSREKIYIQQLLHSKSQEIDKLTSESLRLKERNMSLAKELAALKLVSDFNLDEDEILRFASLGNGANNKDTIDVLRKSLVIRNKSYTELITKCNLLGREKARSCHKLEKAKEKISKLKTRVQELETAGEVKDNEVLRAMKASKNCSSKEGVPNSAEDSSNILFTSSILSEDCKEECSLLMNNLDWTTSMTDDLQCSNNGENVNSTKSKNPDHTKECANTMAKNEVRNSLITKDTSGFSTVLIGISSSCSKLQTNDDVMYNQTSSRSGVNPIDNKEVAGHRHHDLHGDLGLRSGISSDKGIAPAAVMDEDVTVIIDDDAEVQPTLNIKKESPLLVPLSKPGDICFSSGLLGPDGTNRYLGKWCKRGQNKGSVTMQGSSTNSGDLIAVGADGRGGRIKVLRSQTQSSLDGKENFLCAKRLKHGAKASNMQTQGCLQIEHFFGRV